MPVLSKEDTKIVIRPRGGLDISKTGASTVADAILAAAGISQDELSQDTLCPNLQQNIMVASTPRRENADRYARIKEIRISDKVHKLCAYETAPHSTIKVIIRGKPLQDNPATIDGKIVNQNNPLALAAKRIAPTGTVIIAFDGHRVPNYVRYGTLLMKCFLYRKQVDVWYACGRLGHRADVCPTPSDVICRECGLQNHDELHQCTTKCKICGGPHLTAGKECAHRFKTPHIVPRRRFERARPQDQLPTPSIVRSSDQQASSSPSLRGRRRSRSRGRSTSRRGSRSRSASRSQPMSPSRAHSSSRGRSKSRTGSDSSNRTRSKTPTGGKGKSSLTRADRVRGNQTQASTSQDLRDARLTNELEELRRANDSLRKENAQFKQEISRLAAEMAEIRRLALTPPAPQPAACSSAMDTAEPPPPPATKTVAVKRHALDDSRGDETVELLSELKNAIFNIQTGLSHVKEMIAHRQLGLVALSARILRLEGTSHGFLPSTSTSQVSNLHSVIAPPTEGAILEAALSQSKPKHG
ncbi:hypothetical protein HPB49_021218 [Dermacentor silvarum]|uniref:Uncharacterized protein n=1 Tax=Dermacentor silvarum TaxID=543639 RepID=A0ACB8C5E7_DERSI|nr:hypothetical protein HPB49_021218 [Dermacentor silvarum]